MNRSLHHDATAVLQDFAPGDHQQQALRQAYLGFLAAEPQACRRRCDAGHLTASALLLDAGGRQALLTLHGIVGRWLQLGGHCEEDDGTLARAALREAAEESGIEGITVDATPLALDVHPIRCKDDEGTPRASRHFDVQFLAFAPADAHAQISAESLRLGWFPLTDLARGVITRGVTTGGTITGGAITSGMGPSRSTGTNQHSGVDDSVQALAAAALRRLAAPQR